MKRLYLCYSVSSVLPKFVLVSLLFHPPLSALCGLKLNAVFFNWHRSQRYLQRPGIQVRGVCIVIIYPSSNLRARYYR